MLRNAAESYKYARTTFSHIQRLQMFTRTTACLDADYLRRRRLGLNNFCRYLVQVTRIHATFPNFPWDIRKNLMRKTYQRRKPNSRERSYEEHSIITVIHHCEDTVVNRYPVDCITHTKSDKGFRFPLEQWPAVNPKSNYSKHHSMSHFGWKRSVS